MQVLSDDRTSHVTLTLAAAVAAEIESGLLRRVRITDLPGLKRKTAVISRRDRYVSAGTRTFLEILGGCYRVKREELLATGQTNVPLFR